MHYYGLFCENQKTFPPVSKKQWNKEKRGDLPPRHLYKLHPSKTVQKFI